MAFCSAWSVRWQLSRPSTTRMRHPMSRVAQSRHDKRVLVETRIYGGDIEVYVGIFARHPLDTGHGCHGVQTRDPFGPVLLELMEGRREAPSGREHRVQDQDQVLV